MIEETWQKEQAREKAEARVQLTKICKELYAAGVECITLEYNGSEDSGVITPPDFCTKFEHIIDPLNPAQSALFDKYAETLSSLVWPFLPDGFEINEGGYGRIEIDTRTGFGYIHHSRRYVVTDHARF